MDNFWYDLFISVVVGTPYWTLTLNSKGAKYGNTCVSRLPSISALRSLGKAGTVGARAGAKLLSA